MTNPPYGSNPGESEDRPGYGQERWPSPQNPLDAHHYSQPYQTPPAQSYEPYPTYSQPYSLPQQGQPFTGQAVHVYAADNSNNTSLAPVTSLVSGLIGFFIAWIPLLGIAAWVFGPLAIVFGVLGLKRGKAEHKIMSVIGIIAGAIALVWCVGYLAFFVAAAVSGDQ